MPKATNIKLHPCFKQFIKQSVEEAFTDFIYNNQFAFIQSPIDQTIRVLITKKPEITKDPDRFSI